MLQAALIYLAVLLGLSIAAVLTYQFDKRRAQTGGRRVPERVLHLLAVAGGWPGAWWAMRRLRHKTQKVRFRVVFWVLVTVHFVAVGVAAYLLFRLLPASAPAT